ncbi:hypothetical protein [Streptomyces sp. NPDC055006]
MAKLTHGTVTVELNAAELNLIRRGLESLKEWGEYKDQADLDALIALRSDLEGVA